MLWVRLRLVVEPVERSGKMILENVISFEAAQRHS